MATGRVESLRIALFTDSFTPYRSGVTTVVENHSRELARRGHQVLIVRPLAWSRSTPEPIDGVEVVGLPLSIPVLRAPDLYAAAPLVPAARRHLRRFGADVAHMHTEFGCGWAGLIAARSLGVPTVGTLHTFFAEQGYQRALGLPDIGISRSLTWRYSIAFYCRCDAVTCPSSALREALMARGLRPEPVIVSNGIEPAPTPNAEIRAATRREFGLERLGSPLFIHVGRLSAEKSLDVLLDAFVIVASRIPEASLLVVGDGSQRHGIERRIAEEGLDARAISLGTVPHAELISSQILTLADVFVTASTTENQPLSVMEAMSSGLPIVGPRARGIPELVEHGRSGLLVEPESADALAAAMIKLALGEEERKAMGYAAADAMKPHALSAAIDSLEEVYQTVMASRSHRPRRSLRARLTRRYRLRRDNGRPLKRVITRTTIKEEITATIQPVSDGSTEATAELSMMLGAAASDRAVDAAVDRMPISRPSSRQSLNP